MKAWGQPQVGTNALISCTYFRRAVIGTAAIALSLMVAGCKTEGVFPANMKANAPIPQALLSDMEAKNMAKESPMLVRIFKEEAELEVWKQDRAGRYALLKTYPICRWSGDLGPKVKEGDRQAPEGFYDITPAQMNPNSSYYLAFNLGYPNAYDRSWGPHRRAPHGAWRLFVARLLRNVGRTDSGNLRHGTRVVLRRTEVVPGAGLSRSA